MSVRFAALAARGALGAMVIALGLVAAGPAAAQTAVTDGIAYGSGQVGDPIAGPAPLLMDLYQPPRKLRGRRPVVVLIHGGGFAHHTREDLPIIAVAQGLAARGIVVASIDYRLLDQDPIPSARVAPLLAALPPAPLSAAIAAAVDDTLTAIGYLGAHAAELGIDMRRLGLVGSSAGAITADQVAYALDDHGIPAPEVRFVASLWGGILVPPPASEGDVAADQLEPGEPALFAVHGDADTRVPVRLDDQLVARAQAQGVRTEYYRVPGGTHDYQGTQFFTRPVVGSQTAFDRLLLFASQELG